MSIEDVTRLLGWCAALNYSVLLIWFLLFVSARNWLRKLYGRWFTLSDQQFDSIHYAGMGFYKMFTAFFNLVPYLVLHALF